jgi:hypothetical protein
MLGRAVHRARHLARLGRMEAALPKRSFSPALWRDGFLSQRAELYPFDRFERRWFLTDWEIETRLGRVNDERVIPLLDDKLLFHLLVASEPAVAAPEPIGLVANGRFHSLGRHGSLPAGFAAHGRIVCKPSHGAGGVGVSILRPGDALPDRGLFLLEGFVAQHLYAATIFPGSLNTIRVVTLVDGEGAFLAGAAHRFGCAASAPVDNFKRGGISALVELDTGELSTGRSNPGLHAGHVHPVHPDTGARIEGIVVPMWGEVVDLALRLARMVPGLHHVGWDICVAEDGPRVIEGNAWLANPNLIQAHRPILLDPRVRRFMRQHGVLSERRAALLES